MKNHDLGDPASRHDDATFRFLVEHSPDIVWSAGPDGVFDFFNARWYAYTGQTPQQALTADGWQEAAHPDEISSLQTLWEMMRREGVPLSMEARLRAADGTFRWHFMRARLISSEPGGNAKLVGTYTDVHDLRSEKQRLEESERGLRTLANAMPQIVWTARADGWIDWYNERWFEFTGQTLEEAAGWGWQAVHHTEDFPAVMERWPHSIASGEPFEMEFRLRRADGSFRWFLTRVVPMRDAEGKIVRWYGSNTDVDDSRRQADELTVMYERERRIAERLQLAFLPGELPQVDGVRFESVYLPATRESELGGDWYDAFALPDGRVAISIGDVTGHGLDAATTMVRVRETLRATAALYPGRPDRVLQRANRAMEISDPGVLATAIFGIFDPATGSLVYSSAGHPAPILAGKVTVRPLEAGGVPLGTDAEPSMPLHCVTLKAGERIVLYTDGLVESKRDIEAGERRLFSALRAGRRGAAELVATVLDGAQRDDVALLVIEATPTTVDKELSHSWLFASEDAATAVDARNAFVSYLRRRRVSPDALEAAEIVFGELVGNVVRHAPGSIRIAVRWHGNTAEITVHDRGEVFDAPQTLPDDPFSDCGRGLFLVRSYASSPSVAALPGGGKEVRVNLRMPRAG